MDEPLLDLEDFASPVEGLGPGRRLILWVRGCPLACPGCMTPELWDAGAPCTHQSVRQVVEQIAPALRELDGLSISGGEPTLQARALTELIRLLRAMPELGNLEVLSYSGFSMEELRERGADVADYLAQLDLLIDGRFEQSASNDLSWRGSDNQRVHLLSERAQKHAQHAQQPMPEKRPLQLQMLGSARFRLIGIPKRGDLAAYRGALAEQGILARPDLPSRRAAKPTGKQGEGV